MSNSWFLNIHFQVRALYPSKKSGLERFIFNPFIQKFRDAADYIICMFRLAGRRNRGRRVICLKTFPPILTQILTRITQRRCMISWEPIQHTYITICPTIIHYYLYVYYFIIWLGIARDLKGRDSFDPNFDQKYWITHFTRRSVITYCLLICVSNVKVLMI